MASSLYLLDGSALVYRSYYALQRNPLVNSKGEPTSAVFGFAMSLLTLLRQKKPDYLAVVFDAPGGTFRDEIYDQYKANRSAMPDDLRMQLPWVRELVKSWPCAWIEVPGVEADDVIGSYAHQLASDELEVVMVTGDKDFYQLLNPHVSMLNPGRGGPSAIPQKLLGPDDVEAKFAVTGADQVIDVLALMGDSSDNIPGVPGIGPKTAGKLISEHGSLENLYENLEAVKSDRMREKLVTHRDDAFQAKDLVTIRVNLDLPVGLKEMKTKSPGGDALAAFLKRMEFRNLLGELFPAGSPATSTDEATEGAESAQVFPDLKRLQEFLSELEKNPRPLALVVETESGHPDSGSVVGLALAADKDNAYYINVDHDAGNPLPVELVSRFLGPLLANKNIPKVIHDSKAARLCLERLGMPMENLAFDTMIASYVLNPERSHRLQSLGENLLGRAVQGTESLLGKGAKRLDPRSVSADEFGPRIAELASVTLALFQHFTEELKKSEMVSLFETVEMPLAWVLGDMERTGVKIDEGFLAAMSKRLEKRLGELEAEAHSLADSEFNVNSPMQLAEILFDRLGLPTGKKTKTGFSTDSEVLEKLRPHHDLPGVVLEYRQVSKLKSTYVDTLPAMIDLDTERVHAHFNQTVAATGRLSSSDPNLQNIPIRTPLGKEVRKAFIPGYRDWDLVSADYSQIELRIMAHLSQDPSFLEAFRGKKDIHRETAAKIFGVAPKKVTDEQRGQAKTVNFGILYGQGAFGLARTLGISNQEAAEFLKGYKLQYEGVMGYLESTLEEARSQGYVTTLLGRRRYLPNLNAGGGPARAAAERLAINTPIQGSAADLIKVAMVKLAQSLKAKKFEANLLLQVHDELLLECPRSESKELGELVRTEMEQAMELDVPTVVNIGIGANWAEIH
ncbi:MAG: DNA polymerase I [Candidatus Eisenbacteria bacterium]|uniref:DNA polymerase I n=1 Tax=Eiseniibacteriota bacterium TaxID=2212470 RepID=A0A7Y2EAP7_UNCEI|nr:DNA polymerase I [Candidatus Eisenbacteria bacterium]